MNHTFVFPCPAHRQQQRGLSLVELMISLLIGALTSTVALLALQLAQKSSTHTSTLTLMQQQAAYAFQVIGVQVKQAGSLALHPAGKGGSSTSNSTMNAASVTRPPDFLMGMPAVSGALQSDGTHTLTLRFLSSPAQTTNQGSLQFVSFQSDCLGHPAMEPATQPAPSQIISSEFSLSHQNLVCHSSVSTSSNASDGPQKIIGQVTDFKTRYLVQTFLPRDTDFSRPVLQYRNAEQVTEANAWNAVVGLEVCLELQGPTNSTPEGLRNSTYTNCQDQASTMGARLKMVSKNFYQVRSIGNV